MRVTSTIEPGAKVVVVPRRVDHLFLGEFVDWEFELSLSEFDLLLCSEGGDVGVEAQGEGDQGGS